MFIRAHCPFQVFSFYSSLDRLYKVRQTITLLYISLYSISRITSRGFESLWIRDDRRISFFCFRASKSTALRGFPSRVNGVYCLSPTRISARRRQRSRVLCFLNLSFRSQRSGYRPIKSLQILHRPGRRSWGKI